MEQALLQTWNYEITDMDDYEQAFDRFTMGGCGTMLKRIMQLLPDWRGVLLNDGYGEHVVAESPCGGYWLDIGGLYPKDEYNCENVWTSEHECAKMETLADLMDAELDYIEYPHEADPLPEHTDRWARWLLDNAGIQYNPNA